MDYLSIATCSLLVSSFYIKRDAILSSERKLTFLFIGGILVFASIVFLYSFLREFIGIFLFLFAASLFIGSLSK